MKKIVLLLTLCCAVMACKKNNVDFNYSPDEPRAGEAVKFTNLSTSGEEWEWAFGDGVVSTIKSPTHTFKNPGTYMVTLKVDKKKSWTVSKQVTVYDTIPTFVCTDSVFYIYEDYTFTANFYNPYNYEVKYLWWFPINTDYVRVTDENTTSKDLHFYFIQAMQDAPIFLSISVNGETTEIHKSFTVLDRPTNSILMRTNNGDFRQRIFGERAEMYKPDNRSTALLDAEQDTVQTYNGKLFSLRDLASLFEGIEGFHIANRKIYYRANGLWVASVDGANPVLIDTLPCAAMTLDTHDSRIYWANKKGVWYMPFVGSDNNKFVTSPTMLNTITNVSKLAPDYEPK